MKSESIKEIQRTNFFHRLRLIFTYYASHGNKEDPLVLREKSFNKFLTDSNICQLIKKRQNQKHRAKQSSISNSKQPYNKNFQVIINTFNKPMHYKQFLQIITNLITQIRSFKKDEDYEDELQVKKDLYDIYQQDEIVSGIFSFLYQEIQQGTDFGSLIVFSQNKALFEQKVWGEVQKHKNLLTTIYFHYFTSFLRKQTNRIEEIFNILKKFCLDFQIAPLKVSMTEIFIFAKEIIQSKSKSIYEQNSPSEQKQSQFKDFEQWPEFAYYSFAKLLILIANYLDFREHKFQPSFQVQTSIKNLFEYLGTTKGFKHIKSLYKLNDSFYVNDLKKKFTSRQQSPKKVLDFEPKQLEDSKLTQVLESFEKFIEMIFKSYTEHRRPEVMNKKVFEQFCSEFKITPHLASKKEIGEIYLKVFFDRDYFYVMERSNNQNSLRRISEENKLKIYELISKPEYGLRLDEFKKAFIYGAELNKVCDKLTHVQRLIYWVEYIFSQDKTKALIQRSRTRQKFFVEKQINLLSIYQKPLANQNFENNFYKDHESMYKKLKRTLK